jgi:hypothetical protein
MACIFIEKPREKERKELSKNFRASGLPTCIFLNSISVCAHRHCIGRHSSDNKHDQIYRNNPKHLNTYGRYLKKAAL